MKKSYLYVAMAVMVGAMMVVPAVLGQDEAKPAPVTLTGTLTVTKDDMGMVTSAVLKTADGQAVAVKLDYNGRRLARSVAADATVKVTGVVTEAEGAKTIAVQEYSTEEKAPEAPAEE